MKRLRRGIADATKSSESEPQLPPDRGPEPVPCDLYVFDVPVDGAIEWLVVRPHPDDPATVLLAPADDFPLVGCADVALEHEVVDRPLTVRCGNATWVPAAVCPEHLRVGRLPDEAVSLVRGKLAALARGNLASQPDARAVEADPEYAAWLSDVARAREAVKARADAAPVRAGGRIFRFEQFTRRPPAVLTEDVPMTLAARSGGPLLEAVAESLAGESPRYCEVPLSSGGVLQLTADDAGLRLGWAGPIGSAPPHVEIVAPDAPLAVSWRAGTTAGFHRADAVILWRDGQVVLVVGTDTPETLTVRL
jgi:hypothetical protein